MKATVFLGADPANGLNDAGFVVGDHHAGQHRFRADRPSQNVEIQESIGLHRQDGYLRPQTFQMTHGIEHSTVQLERAGLPATSCKKVPRSQVNGT